MNPEKQYESVEFRAEAIGASIMPLKYDPALCIGCGRCIEACQIDVILPAEVKGGVPRVFYPGECWYCGACVMECPIPGALTLRHPLMNQARFIEKEQKS